MIRYETGDLLKSKTFALVNAVNCEGIMGKGIAYQFKKQFPENYEIYRYACRNKNFNIGEVLVVPEKGRLIVNFPTKNTWRKKSKYEFIEEGLKSLKEEIIKRQIDSISIPPLGCGNGGLDWKRVESMILDVLSDLDTVDVVLYPPVSKNIGFREDSELINIKHLLVCYAYEQLKDKRRYNLNCLFYICNLFLKSNLFDFSIVHNRPHSSELRKITDEIKVLKDKYGDDFEGFLEGYINTVISKEIEREYDEYISIINVNVNIINELRLKEDVGKIMYIYDLIGKGVGCNDFFSDEDTLFRKITNELLISGIAEKNLFDEVKLLKII